MPKINPKKVKKPTKKVSTKPRTKTTLIKAQSKVKNTKIKNPLEYYECMKACCQKKQKISQTAHECKNSALVINAKMSAQKKKAAQKIKAGYKQMGAGLSEFIKASK